MAVVLLAQRLVQHREDRSGSSAGIVIGQPGALAYLPDEVVEPDRVCLFPAAPPRLQLLCQVGQVCGKAPRLAVAQLAREPLQDGPGEIADSSRDNLVRSATARASRFWSTATAPFAGLPASIWATGPGQRLG